MKSGGIIMIIDRIVILISLLVVMATIIKS